MADARAAAEQDYAEALKRIKAAAGASPRELTLARTALAGAKKRLGEAKRRGKSSLRANVARAAWACYPPPRELPREKGDPRFVRSFPLEVAPPAPPTRALSCQALLPSLRMRAVHVRKARRRPPPSAVHVRGLLAPAGARGGARLLRRVGLRALP